MLRTVEQDQGIRRVCFALEQLEAAQILRNLQGSTRPPPLIFFIRIGPGLAA